MAPHNTCESIEASMPGEWHQRWAQTDAELAALSRRFCEIHDHPKSELPRFEPELKALRQQCVEVGKVRYGLAMQVSALRFARRKAKMAKQDARP